MSTFFGVSLSIASYGFHWAFPESFYVRDIGFFRLEELAHPAFASVVFEDSAILRRIDFAGPITFTSDLGEKELSTYEKGHHLCQRPSLEEIFYEDIFIMLAKYLARENSIMGSLAHDPYANLRQVKNSTLPEFTPLQRDLFSEIYRKEYDRRSSFSTDMRFLDLLARKQAEEDRKDDTRSLDLSLLYKGTVEEEAFFIEAYKEAYRQLLVVQKIFS